MNNNMLLAYGLIAMLFFSFAAALESIPSNEHAKERAVSPGVSSAFDADWQLDKFEFVHYAKNTPGKAPKQNTCYNLMGVKWFGFPVHYYINPTNSGLSDSYVLSAVSKSAETWDQATAIELFENTYDVDTSETYGNQNFRNVITFGKMSDNKVIAVTSVWYTRRTRQIVEFDMEFNTFYTWGDGMANPLLMDLQNIATHELGHAVGLADIYTTSCSSVTMFGYSTEGDIDKRTLESADIAGLRKIYG